MQTPWLWHLCALSWLYAELTLLMLESSHAELAEATTSLGTFYFVWRIRPKVTSIGWQVHARVGLCTTCDICMIDVYAMHTMHHMWCGVCVCMCICTYVHGMVCVGVC